MDKISHAQVGQMMKLAAENLRALSEKNAELEAKVVHFEKKSRAEKIALQMEEKGLQPELDVQEKIAGLMQREDLDVIEEAVGLSAPQMKLASLAEGNVPTDGATSSEAAESNFAAALASLD